MNDDTATDAGIYRTTTIPIGMHSDLKGCLLQALENLEGGKYDQESRSWVIQTDNIEWASELVEAFLDFCDRELGHLPQ